MVPFTWVGGLRGLGLPGLHLFVSSTIFTLLLLPLLFRKFCRDAALEKAALHS